MTEPKRSPTNAPAAAPSSALELRTRGDGPAPRSFRRGAHWPFAVRWFGITSLFGHARSLIASAIASEQIDSRDWMTPDTPGSLLASCARVLHADATKATLVEALGRPLWIDFVADTGDDRDVSEAVGRMIFASYRVREGDTLRELPRGDVLLFGGDTAYPVATADEIQRRVIQPWNRVLDAGAAAKADEPPPRVLLGIPGNHDWYDGTDGFARMFRAKLPAVEATSAAPPESADRTGSTDDATERQRGWLVRLLHLDEVSDSIGLFASLGRTLRALAQGTKVVRRKRLVLRGYEPVQEATYWALPLAPGLDAYGVDRQLRRLDFRQRSFFHARRREHPDARILFVAPDPARAYGERWEPGARMLEACKLRFTRDRIFYLTGDIHHYERRPIGGSLHVIAGGGGAFVCGTRVDDGPSGPSAAAYPSAAASKRLALQVPLRLMLGGAGFLVHWVFAFVALIELAAHSAGLDSFVVAAAIISAVMTGSFYVNGGHHGVRAHPRKVLGVALAYGVGLGILPVVLRLALPQIAEELAEDSIVVVVYAFLGALGFGFFLMTLALLGLQNQQAYVVLSHPGFKHFVRLCVHPDGKVEAFTIGKDDPLAEGDPVLVDRFAWDVVGSR